MASEETDLTSSVLLQHIAVSTSEAAHYLGVSRPNLTRLMETGELPFQQFTRHRRIRLTDLLEYQQRMRRIRAAGLDAMVRESEDAGLYDLPVDLPFERLPIDDDQLFLPETKV